MTTSRTMTTILTVLTFCHLLLLLPGCGGGIESDESSGTVAESAHDGHNHAPGEEHGEQRAVDSLTLADWCAEHAVPESECTKCNPSLIVGFQESGDWCAGHDLPESHCRLCNSEIVFPQELLIQSKRTEQMANEINVSLNLRDNAAICATDGALIQFASATTAERTGIKVQLVLGAPGISVNDAPAEIVFDESTIFAVSISVEAQVTNWIMSSGDEVEYGQPLAELQSPEVARLSSQLLTAHARYLVEQRELERHQKLMERNLISEADWDMKKALAEQAQAEFISARSLLLSAGLHEQDVSQILKSKQLSNQYLLRAPKQGVIIERMAGIGELLDAGSTFATIGDPIAMWIEARLTERQMHDINVGDKLVFSSDGGGINRVGGEVIWVSRFLDPHTRTGPVRARIIDGGHRLRAGEFGRVEIANNYQADVVLVPKDAVQWEGCCNVVFVKESDDQYRPRKVQMAGSQGAYYQVTNGVLPGQEIVVEGAFLLKTELKKSSIGAGCCGLEPAG